MNINMLLEVMRVIYCFTLTVYLYLNTKDIQNFVCVMLKGKIGKMKLVDLLYMSFRIFKYLIEINKNSKNTSFSCKPTSFNSWIKKQTFGLESTYSKSFCIKCY